MASDSTVAGAALLIVGVLIALTGIGALIGVPVAILGFGLLLPTWARNFVLFFGGLFLFFGLVMALA